MERTASITRAKEIMGKNFIGPDELFSIKDQLGISFQNVHNIPTIPFPEDFLISLKDSAVLILAVPFYKDNSPLTILKLRKHFGWDPSISEPCFYNQDWYLKEPLANASPPKLNWYLLSKNLLEKSRGKAPDIIERIIPDKQKIPTAFLCSFVFFSYYIHTRGEILWKNDYLWCSDTDHYGDQIFVGRYIDPTGVNKKGFSIHRHLSIKACYGFAGQILDK